jgi:CheY-like chemotaxis protein
MMKKALIIEDDQFMIANLTELLSLEGFEVQSFNNGSDALNCARAFRPDIILSDMRMPGMDGLEVLDAVRGDARIAGTPFIFLTGRSESDQLHDALNRGADGYLIKPFQVHELLEVINQFLPQ